MKLGTHREMKIYGHYINLDRSHERNKYMEESLAISGLADFISRFPGICGDDRPKKISNSELGCFLSHQAVIDRARDDGYTLVLEDDVLFARNFKRYLEALLNETAHTWDILFLGNNVPYFNIPKIRGLLNAKRKLGDGRSGETNHFKLFDGLEWYGYGAFAYVLHPDALARVRDFLKGIAEQGYVSPIDIAFRRMIDEGVLKSNVVFPYIVGTNADFPTTIADRGFAEEHQLLGSMLINLFVAGYDTAKLANTAYSFMHNSRFDLDAFICSQVIYKKIALEK